MTTLCALVASTYDHLNVPYSLNLVFNFMYKLNPHKALNY